MKSMKRLVLVKNGCVTLLVLIMMTALSGFPGLIPAACADSTAGTVSHVPATDLPPDPALVSGRLDNGFSYMLLENHKPENRVEMRLVVHAGSFNETDNQRGLAHFLEHILFCGSTHFKPGELVKYFQKIGMRFGNDANAQTGFFRTIYELHLPSGDDDSIRDGLVVFRDFADGALILPSEVDRERNVILAEKRTRDSVSYRTFEATLGFELAGSRVADRLPIGSEEVIKKAGSKDLRAFYDTWYRPERMTLVMVGDFSPARAKALIKEAFGSMKARAPAIPDPDFGRVCHNGEKYFYHFEKEAGSTDLSIETITQEDMRPDSAAAKKERFIRDAAFRIINHRLEDLAESDAPPFTSAQAGSGRIFEKIKYSYISATCSPEKWGAGLTAIEHELRSAILYGFTEAETERVKKELLTNLDRAVKQSATRDSGVLAGWIIHCLATGRVFQSPVQEKELLAPVAESFSPMMLHDAFKKAWAPPNRLVMVAGNVELKNGSLPPAERIKAVFEKSKAAAVEKPATKKAPVFPYLPDPSTPGKIVSDRTIEELGIRQVDFANGVRLNLKKTDFEANQVSATVRFGRGSSGEPPDKQALSELSGLVINESGFGGMTNDELRQALAGKTADIYFSVRQDSFALNGNCASDETRLLFQLFYTFYNDFGCREDALQRSLDSMAQSYKEMEHTIDGAMARFGRRFLAGGDTRIGMPPDYDAFAKVTPDDIRSWVKNGMSLHAPEVSIVGDFDEDGIIKAAALYFGSMDKSRWTGRPVVERPSPSFPGGQSLKLDVPTAIQKAMVDVAWPTVDCWDIHTNRRLFVLADILTDRMRMNIRNEEGKSYSQFAYQQGSCAYPGYGVLHAVAEVSPAETDEVARSIRGIAAAITRQGITSDELERALEPALTHIREMRRRNGYWLNTVLAGSREHPERLEWAKTMVEDFSSISVSQLTGIAGRYLDNSKSAVITIRPAARETGTQR